MEKTCEDYGIMEGREGTSVSDTIYLAVKVNPLDGVPDETVAVGVTMAAALQGLGEFIISSPPDYNGCTYKLVSTRLYGFDELKRDLVLSGR